MNDLTLDIEIYDDDKNCQYRKLLIICRCIWSQSPFISFWGFETVLRDKLQSYCNNVVISRLTPCRVAMKLEFKNSNEMTRFLLEMT